MLPNIKQIWENKHLIATGLVNRFFSPREIKELANKRLAICNVCPDNSKNTVSGYNVPYRHCTLCGCSLALKPYAKQSKCPVNKW